MLACARGKRFALRAVYEREARWLLGVALRIDRPTRPILYVGRTVAL